MDQQVIRFLIRAKQATYAGKGAETASSRPGSHDLVYRDGDWMYYDTYLGGDKFAGEEALWISGVPRWSMNYAGRVTGENFSGDFLKEALLHDATSFILVHNHPSGNLKPSRYDEELTQRVNRAAQAVNLRMIDHVIVTEGDYYSFSENGKI